MENASKALIMAGGMLIAGLLIALIAYLWSSFSEYQSSRDEIKNIENTAKFNQEFTNYDRDDVLGYEILSLLNKVADYNERMTSDTKYGNDEIYPPVSMTIQLEKDKAKNDDYDRRKIFTYDGQNVLLLNNAEYKDTEKVEENKRKSFKRLILDEIKQIQTSLDADDTTLTSMAKNIGSMFLTEKQIRDKMILLKDEYLNEDEKLKAIGKNMITKFNSFVKSDYKLNDYTQLIIDDISKNNMSDNKNIKSANGNNLGNVYKKLCAYYEYMQFKRGIFKCTKIGYDDGKTGRVIEIKFEFSGSLK